MATITVFISYAWESEEHVAWVTMLADELEHREDIHVVFDQYDLHAGKDITHFMDEALRSDRIVVIVTPLYVAKTHRRMGGVGYEASVISADLLRDQLATKFVPALRAGDDVPSFLRTKHYVDFRRDDRFQTSVLELLDALRGVPKRQRPPKMSRSTLAGSSLSTGAPRVDRSAVHMAKTAHDEILTRYAAVRDSMRQRKVVPPGIRAVRTAWQERDALFAQITTFADELRRSKPGGLVIDKSNNDCSLRLQNYGIHLMWTHRYLDDLGGAALFAIESNIFRSGISEEVRRTRFGVTMDGATILWVEPTGAVLTSDALASWVLARLMRAR